jgi:hypothetical protein
MIFEKNSNISVLKWWYRALSSARHIQAASLGQQLDIRITGCNHRTCDIHVGDNYKETPVKAL